MVGQECIVGVHNSRTTELEWYREEGEVWVWEKSKDVEGVEGFSFGKFDIGDARAGSEICR